MNTKLGPFINEIRSLEATLESEQKNTATPGNLYVCSLSGRIGGMKLILEHPSYAAAPEMLEALVEAREALFNLQGNGGGVEHKAYRQIMKAVAKARGES